jgi:hypothetical protein
LLAYVVEEQPVTSATVQAALDDLKGLPLHWNQPLPAPNEDSLTGGSDGAGLNGGGSPVGAAGNEELDVTQYAEVSTSRDDITEPALEWETSEMAVIEVGGDECGATNADVRRQIPEALQPDTDRAAHVTEPEQTHEFCIEDRYARLDQLAEAGLKLEREPRAAFADPAVVPAAPELQLLSQVTELRDEIHIVRPVESAGRLAAVDGYAGDETFPENDDNLTWDVIEPEWDAPTDDQPPTAAGNQDLTPAVAVPSPDVFDFTPIHDGLALLSSPSPATERCVARPAVSDGRRYAQLFTRLKRRRREVCEALRAMSPASGP